LRAAQSIGYAGVELAEQEVWQSIRDAGLEIVAIKAHESLANALNSRGHFSALRAEIETSIAVAERWGIPNLLCFSGNRSAEGQSGAEITADHLRTLAPIAEAANVTLLLELLNSKIDHIGYECDSTAWGVKVVEMVGSPRVKLLFDIYHMQIMEGDLIRTIRTHASHFGHYHTAGNPGRSDLDDSQEIHYPGIMRAISDVGYDGYIGQEFMPRGDPIAALRHAFEVCAGTRIGQ
jgi:hydroxypyruvate isomerase